MRAGNPAFRVLLARGFAADFRAEERLLAVYTKSGLAWPLRPLSDLARLDDMLSFPKQKGLDLSVTKVWCDISLNGKCSRWDCP